MLDLYVFRMSLFDHGKLEELLLFVINFQMTLAATWTLETESNIQYLRKIVLWGALRQFGLLPFDVKIYRNPVRCGLST